MGIRLLPGLGQVGWPSAGFRALHDLGVAAAAGVPHQPSRVSAAAAGSTSMGAEEYLSRDWR
jgi:hypothetical protein